MNEISKRNWRKERLQRWSMDNVKEYNKTSRTNALRVRTTKKKLRSSEDVDVINEKTGKERS